MGVVFAQRATKTPTGRPPREGITEALVTVLFVRIWSLVLPIPQDLNLANSLRCLRQQVTETHFASPGRKSRFCSFFVYYLAIFCVSLW